jgi:hypothetical protein
LALLFAERWVPWEELPPRIKELAASIATKPRGPVSVLYPAR